MENKSNGETETIRWGVGIVRIREVLTMGLKSRGENDPLLMFVKEAVVW